MKLIIIPKRVNSPFSVKLIKSKVRKNLRQIKPNRVSEMEKQIKALPTWKEKMKEFGIV